MQFFLVQAKKRDKTPIFRSWMTNSQDRKKQRDRISVNVTDNDNCYEEKDTLFYFLTGNTLIILDIVHIHYYKSNYAF